MLGVRMSLGWLFCFSVATAFAETWVDVTTSSGEHVIGAVQQWNADGIVIAGEQAQEITAHRLLSIRFPKQSRRVSAGAYVLLANGDRYAVDTTQIRDEQFSGTWINAPLRPAISLPLEAVSAVLFSSPPGPVDSLDLLSELPRRSHGVDTVQLIAGDQLTGEFRSLMGGLLEMQAAVGPLKLDRRRVQWLGLDPELAAELPTPPERWIAYLTDGSRITARNCVPRSDLTVQLTPVVGNPVSVPWYELVRLQQITAEQDLLSELQPLEESYQPYLGGRVAREQNQSAAGSPLQLRGEEFAYGLGWRSRSSVSYAIEPAHQWFRCSVGIDDAAAGRGSARFRIELDGQEVWASGEVTGRSDRVETPVITVKGHRRLALIVEFGERGDIGDLADWCDPILMRNR